MDRLVLNEFKAAYRALQPHLVKPLDFLVYGALVWLQEKVIDYKITTAVDQAIKEFEEHNPLTQVPNILLCSTLLHC